MKSNINLVNNMHVRQSLRIIESSCQQLCPHIEIEFILLKFSENQEYYEAELSDIEWPKRFLTKTASQSVLQNTLQEDESSIPTPQDTIAVTGWDTQVVVAILQSLCVANGTLAKNILDFYKIESDYKPSRKEAIILFLKQTKLFTALQYIIAISILTGGVEAAAIDLKKLLRLLDDAELELSDFINYSVAHSYYYLACDKDDPAILLTILNIEKFNLKSLSVLLMQNENLLDHIFRSKKYNILKSIFHDLDELDLLAIKFLFKKMKTIEDESTLAVLKQKLKDDELFKQVRIHDEQMSLLNFIAVFCQKLTDMRSIDNDSKIFAAKLLAEIENEKYKVHFTMSQALYESFKVLLRTVKAIPVQAERSSLSVRESLFTCHKKEYINGKRNTLDHMTSFLKDLLLSPTKDSDFILTVYFDWLIAAIAYNSIDNACCDLLSKKIQYPHNFEGYLEIQQINVIAYRMGYQAVDEFLTDMCKDSFNLNHKSYACRKFLEIYASLQSKLLIPPINNVIRR